MPPCEPDCTKNMTDFNGSDFPPDQDCTHVFLTWKLPVEQTDVEQTLQINFDINASTASQLDCEQIWLTGEPVAICPNSGHFIRNLS